MMIAKKVSWKGLCAVAMALVMALGYAALLTPKPALAADGQVTMYRLYNLWSGEHFYTADASERDGLVRSGWTDEGIGWIAPTTGDAVYRVYNPYSGDHHYTLDASEKSGLVRAGWVDEGIGWYSATNKKVPLYREYNPYMSACNHNYTTDIDEHNGLVRAGWLDEGIGWYGIGDADGVVEDDSGSASETESSSGDKESGSGDSGSSGGSGQGSSGESSGKTDETPVVTHTHTWESVTGPVLVAEAYNEVNRYEEKHWYCDACGDCGVVTKEEHLESVHGGDTDYSLGSYHIFTISETTHHDAEFEDGVVDVVCRACASSQTYPGEAKERVLCKHEWVPVTETITITNPDTTEKYSVFVTSDNREFETNTECYDYMKSKAHEGIGLSCGVITKKRTILGASSTEESIVGYTCSKCGFTIEA